MHCEKKKQGNGGTSYDKSKSSIPYQMPKYPVLTTYLVVDLYDKSASPSGLDNFLSTSQHASLSLFHLQPFLRLLASPSHSSTRNPGTLQCRKGA